MGRLSGPARYGRRVWKFVFLKFLVEGLNLYLAHLRHNVRLEGIPIIQ